MKTNKIKTIARPYLAVLLCIVTIEVLFLSLGKNLNKKYSSNFFEYAFKKQESLQKFVINEKLSELLSTKADIFSVGDSSGLYGINPSILGIHLKDISFLNLNVAADMGFAGYRSMARLYLERNPGVKKMILYFTPYSMPKFYGAKNKLSESIYDNFLGFSKLLNIPSLAYRLAVTNLIYYPKSNQEIYRYRIPYHTRGPSYKQISDLLKTTRGWLPYIGVARGLQSAGPCSFFVEGQRDTTFKKELELTKKVAEHYHVRFSVIPHYVPCTAIGYLSDYATAQWDNFAYENQEIQMPFDLISTLPRTNFVDRWHLTDDASKDFSYHFGELLAKWNRNEDVENYYRNSFVNSKSTKLNGEVKAYAREGYMQSIRNYRNGQLHGEFKNFYPDGSLWARRVYQNGKLEGEALVYSEDGEIQWTFFFKNGELENETAI